MYQEKNFTIIFIKLTIHIENNQVIQLCEKFKEDLNLKKFSNLKKVSKSKTKLFRISQIKTKLAP